MKGRARVLIADDHVMVRHGLKLVLEREPDFQIVAEASDGHEAIALAEQGVDLAVLDVTMPGLSGIQVTRELTRRRPPIPVVVLSMHANQQFIREASGAGASGYVLKSMADHHLVAACRAALIGEPFRHRDGVGSSRSRPEGGVGGALTARETEILVLIAEALTSREIAERLGIAAKTVDAHRANIYAKLGMRDRVELARYAIRLGLISP